MSHWKEFRAEHHGRSEPDVDVWRLSGALTNSKESYDFLEAVRAGMRERPRPVVLNLEKVDHATSAGIGIIAAAYTSAVNAGARLVLAALPKQVRTVLNILNLLSIIEHAESEEQAIERLGR